MNEPMTHERLDQLRHDNAFDLGLSAVECDELFAEIDRLNAELAARPGGESAIQFDFNILAVIATELYSRGDYASMMDAASDAMAMTRAVHNTVAAAAKGVTL